MMKIKVVYTWYVKATPTPSNMRPYKSKASPASNRLEIPESIPSSSTLSVILLTPSFSHAPMRLFCKKATRTNNNGS